MEQGGFAREFLAGNVGGLLGIVAVYPLDTAKTRMQIYPEFKTVGGVFRHMMRSDGVSCFTGNDSFIWVDSLCFNATLSMFVTFSIQLSTEACLLRHLGLD